MLKRTRTLLLAVIALFLCTGGAAAQNMKTVQKDGFCFTYDADRVKPEVSSGLVVVNIAFRSIDDNDNCLAGYSFMPSEMEPLSELADSFFESLRATSSEKLTDISLGATESATVLGEQGYAQTGTATVKGTGEKVKITFKICNYKGKFTFIIEKMPIDDSLQPDAEIAKAFADIEASLVYSAQ